MNDRTAVRTAIIAVAAFVVLGMPKAAFAVAWPTAADDLGKDISQLGLLVSLYVGGYLAGTLSMGRLDGRYGTGRLLTFAAALAATAIAGYAAAGSWTVLAGAAIVLGLAGGWLDAGMNAHVAVHRGARVMGWIHAGFGIGSALGPLAMTGLLASGAGWRAGYWGMVVLQGAVFVSLLSTRDAWGSDRRRSPRVPVPNTPAVRLTLALFFLYVGLEVAAGQWGYTLLTEGRGISGKTAGLAVTGFWVALTGMRILLGLAGDRMQPGRVAGVGTVAAAGLTTMLWWSPAQWVDVAALVGIGAALGPVFPLQTLMTPRRVGAEATPSMVGLQMAAASVGAIVIPGGLGPLIGRFGVGVVAPVLAASAGALVIVVEAARRATDR